MTIYRVVLGTSQRASVLSNMRFAASILTLACVLLAVHRCVALDNGLSIKPAMGFNTWNAFNVDSALACSLLMVTGRCDILLHACVLHALGSCSLAMLTATLSVECAVNEQKIRDMADALVNRGFVEAGYTYLNIDGGRVLASHRCRQHFPQQHEWVTTLAWVMLYVQ